MAGLPTARANALCESEYRAAARYLRLYTVAPTSSSAGTEVAGSGYTGMLIAFNAAAAGAVVQTSDIAFPAATSDYSAQVVAWAVTDAAGTTMYRFKSLTSPRTVLTGDVVKFNAGDIVLSFA